LTTPGLRTLEQEDLNYHSEYIGGQPSRDAAYHQGTVWCWLKGPFIEADLRVHGDIERARLLLDPLADMITAAGLGTLGEICDADPPFRPRGCVAQAWTVAEVLRIWTLIDEL
jgi:glycogen debranching enzyme